MTVKDALEALIKAFADLEKAVRSDDKTPLQNALALGEAKENFGGSEDSPNVIVFADINDFKFINGKYGYADGDSAINQIGIMILEHFVEKCEAQAFRQSGDEFIILLPDKFLNEFKDIVNLFKSCDVPGEKGNFQVSVGFGYAIKQDDELDFEKLRARAETACKYAKKQGDGICIEWTEEIEQNALESLRKNCTNCGAVTSCYVPQKMNLTSIQFCAVCGTKLS